VIPGTLPDRRQQLGWRSFWFLMRDIGSSALLHFFSFLVSIRIADNLGQLANAYSRKVAV
jgi:hypothetical protein